MDKESLIKDMMHQAVTDAPLFRTYDDDYDVIDRDQVMRCLANLDKAIEQFNIIKFDASTVNDPWPYYSVDAIFTALTIMQRNLQSAIEYEAEQVMESKREMEAIGGKK